MAKLNHEADLGRTIVRHQPSPAYDEIFEREGRWFVGPNILADIVLHLQGRSLVAQRDPDNPDSIAVTLPFPLVRDERTGQMMPVWLLIPEELRGIFWAQCEEIARRVVRGTNLDQFLSRQLTDDLVYRVNAALAQDERERRSRGDPELWHIAAECWGLNWLALPKPAGLVAKLGLGSRQGS